MRQTGHSCPLLWQLRAPSSFKLDWNKKAERSQRQDFYVVLLRLKALFMVNASFPITAISSEVNGILPLCFMFIDMYFLAELTVPCCFFFFYLEIAGSQKSFKSNELNSVPCRAVCSPSKWAGVKMGTSYTLMCVSGQQHEFCCHVSG